MAKTVSGLKTIIDMSDGGSLDADINCNHPKIQIYDHNNSTYNPDWSAADNAVVLAAVVYLGNKDITQDTNLSVTWKVQDGEGTATTIAPGNTPRDDPDPYYMVSNKSKTLTIRKNRLGSSLSKRLTYIANIQYNDLSTNSMLFTSTSITFSLLETGNAIHEVIILGDRVFTATQASTDYSYSPSSITLSATLTNVEMVGWQYLSSNSENGYSDYPNTSGISGNILTVQPTDNIWRTGANYATIRAVARNVTDQTLYYDTYNIYKIYDGTSTPVVFLSNEDITFTADSDGAIIKDYTYSLSVIGYNGTSKVAPTISSINAQSLPSGMTITQTDDTNDEAKLRLTVAAGSTFSTAQSTHGSVNIDISYPTVTTLSLRWKKVNNNNLGMSFSVYAPRGRIFKNKQDTLLLTAYAFDGIDIINENTAGASFQWSKNNNGTFTPIANATSTLYEVTEAEVLSSMTFKCELVYDNVTYSDACTLEDKTDSYQASIDSTNGNYFHNKDSFTCLSCRIWQDGVEVDPLKSTTFATTAPTTGTWQTGEYMYIKNTSVTSWGMPLSRYDGTQWVNVNNNASYKHKYTYNWTVLDSKGNIIASNAATTKVIYAPATKADEITVFNCQIEEDNKVIAVAQYVISYPFLNAKLPNGENLLSGTSRTIRTQKFDTPPQGNIFSIADTLVPDPAHYGDTVTLNCYIDATLSSVNCRVRMMFRSTFFGGSYPREYGNYVMSGTEGWSTLTTIIPENTQSIVFSIEMSGAPTVNDTIDYHSVKLEYGDIPTVWTEKVEEQISDVVELVEKTKVTLDILLGNNGDLDQLLSEEDSNDRNEGIIMAVSKTLWEQTGQQTTNMVQEICNRLETSIGGFADIYQKNDSDSSFMSWLKFRAAEPALYIGSTDSDTPAEKVFQTKITDKSMQFLQGESVVAEINNNELIINQAHAKNIFSIGGLRASVDVDNSITWTWL